MIEDEEKEEKKPEKEKQEHSEYIFRAKGGRQLSV